MPAALIWLIAALALAGAEALTGDLFLLMLGGGALAAAGSSLIFDELWVHGAVFAVVSVLLLVLVRPALRRHSRPAQVCRSRSRRWRARARWCWTGSGATKDR